MLCVFCALFCLLGAQMNFAEARTLAIQKRAIRQANDVGEIHRLFDDIGGKNPVDLILILDRSKSISKEVFYLRVKKLAKAVLTQYATLDPDYVRLSLITFAVNSTVVFDSITYPEQAKTKCELFNGENAIWESALYEDYLPETNIRAALRDSIDIFRNGSNNRPGVKQVIYMISDGKYNDQNDPIDEATLLKESMGVTIYGVGIGVWLEIGNVRILTSQINDVHLYGDYGQWKDYVQTQGNLTSYSDDTSSQWSKVGTPTCEQQCGENAECYCDVIRGYETCLCKAGYFRNATSGTCTVCPPNTYKTNAGNDDQCMACPTDTVSPSGSSAKSQCTCASDSCFDPCENVICGDHKMCVVNRDTNTSSCACKDGWEGPKCDVNIDACASNPCQHGSVCVDGVGTDVFTCVCVRWGYVGKSCQINEDECVPGLCVNGANCTDLVNNFQCECPPGKVGRYCQDNYVPPRPSPTPGPDPVVSSTTTTARTTTVTAAPVEPEDDMMFWIIVGASAGGGLLVLIIIIIVCVVVCRKKKNKNKNNKKEVKQIAHQFSGFWKRKTVRGSKWMDEEVNGGLPSAPSEHRPDLLKNTNNIHCSVENLKTDEYAELPYQTMTLKTGMESWQNYITELEESKVIERAIIVKLGGDKMARTGAWMFDQSEIDRLTVVMDDGEENVPVHIQDGEYHLRDNDGNLASGKTIGENQEDKIVVVGKTKTYLVVAIAVAVNDDGKAKKEVQWIVDHISGEGY